MEALIEGTLSFEAGRHLADPGAESLTSPAKVEKVFRETFGELLKGPQECFLLLLADGQRKPIMKPILVGLGSIDETIADCRRIFSLALKSDAKYFYTCHNHPSGSLIPSENDLALHIRLKDGGDLLGVTLVDNLILHPVEGHKSIAFYDKFNY